MKKFMDIERIKEKYATAFSVGENIVCEEKIDGANASFTYDTKTDSVASFSRNMALKPDNTLQGFYNFVGLFDKEVVKSVTLNGRYIIFGEWLVKHTIKYPEDCYNNFYMFDVWDTVDECYLPFNLVKEMYDMLVALGINIRFVPVFYIGKFTSWEDIQKMVGRTEVGAEPCGEGVVVKTLDRLNDKTDRTPKYLKIVAERFSEVQSHKGQRKPVDPEVLKRKEEERQFVATIVTDRRIDKCLEKLVDEGILPVDWDEHNMKDIAKNLPSLVYADCKKEEPEDVAKVENFGKICGSLTMNRVKELLKSR